MTKRWLFVPALALSLVLAASTSASATDLNRLDESGVMSLSLGIPAGGNPYAPGALGVWYMVSSPINLGINFGMRIDSRDEGEESVTATNFLIAPAVKYYININSRVAPYILGQLNLGFANEGGEDSETETTVSTILGLGIEWFPVAQMSIGGYTGLAINLVRPDPQGFGMNTLTSGLTAQFYFR